VKIWITGCARTGTTLLGRLFYGYEGVTVIDPEIELEYFIDASGASTPHYSGKRSVGSIFSNDLSGSLIKDQSRLIQDNDVMVVNIIRDGRDVISLPKDGTVATPKRWVASMKQARDLKYLICYTVRYELLCEDPDGVQEALGAHLGLGTLHRWSDYPAFVPESVFERVTATGEPFPTRYGARKIEPSTHRTGGHRANPLVMDCPNEFEYWLDAYESRTHGTAHGV